MAFPLTLRYLGFDGLLQCSESVLNFPIREIGFYSVQ